MSRERVLQLYRSMIRESKRFTDYNFRNYALQRTRHDFQKNKAVTDSELQKQLIHKAEENLDMIRRQVVVGQMYGEGHLVIEKKESPSQS